MKEKFLLRKMDKHDKKGVSLMLSYVILIFIVISLWGLIYAWMKLQVNISPPVDCKEGTSVVLAENTCSENLMRFKIENNGRFNVDGVIISVGNNSKNIPTTYLVPYYTQPGKTQLEGYFYFDGPLAPRETKEAVFSNKKKDGNTINIKIIQIIQIQPFIFDKKNKIICQNAVITQKISQCI